ncbi:MAG: ATP-binding protein [Pseudomonadota bacterium]|nr:ATP-binding protein [Pseudomonadota bacterium]
MRGRVVALLGAESTGKTTLAQALGAALVEAGWRVTVVAEFLREFCIEHGRTPRQDEQAAIAGEQTRRIEAARAKNDLVVADTTALMVAVYSETVFGDTSLYDSARAAQRGFELTLVTALDLPWHADGHQRTGAHVRPSVDALLRGALERGGIAWCEISGAGDARLAAAQRAVAQRFGAGPAATRLGPASRRE